MNPAVILDLLEPDSRKGVEYRGDVVVAKVGVPAGALFTEHVDEYEQHGMFFSEQKQSLARSMIRQNCSNLTPASVVLEIGAGSGHYSKAFISEGLPFATYIINDNSLPMLERCAENLRSSPPAAGPVVFFCGDIAACRFRADSFDLIFGNAILHHILDYKAFLAEVHRILRPDGCFFVREPLAQPFLMAAILFQLAIYISEATKDPFAPPDKGKLDAFCNNVIARARGLLPVDELRGMEDKHLFHEGELGTLCKRIGFSTVEFVRDAPPARGGGPCSQFLDLNRGGLGLESKASIDLIARLCDRIMPELFGEMLVPQKTLRVTK